MRNVRAKVQLFSPIPSFISCVIRKYCKICNAWVSHKCLFGNFAFFVNMYVFSFIPSWADPQTSEFGEDVRRVFLSLFGCNMNELHEFFFLIVCKWAWCIHLQGGISVKVCLSSIHRKNPPSWGGWVERLIVMCCVSRLPALSTMLCFWETGMWGLLDDNWCYTKEPCFQQEEVNTTASSQTQCLVYHILWASGTGNQVLGFKTQ